MGRCAVMNGLRSACTDGQARVLWLVVLAVAFITGCGTSPPREEAYDPLQPLNRKVYRINREIDRIVLKPAADAYVKVTPKPVRTAMSNFFDNAGYLDTVLNQFLQGKFKKGFSDTGRFVVNSTVGVLGLFDVATPMGLPEHEEDFGQTLGVWGVGEGLYAMLPLLGPTTARDAPQWPVSALTSLLYYVHNPLVTIPLGILGAIDERARAGGVFEFIDVAAVDPYIFVREGYRQRRTFLIYDGHPPAPKFEEEMDEAMPPEQGKGAEPGKVPETKGAEPGGAVQPRGPVVSEGAPLPQGKPPPDREPNVGGPPLFEQTLFEQTGGR